jgi:tetratricopeptide (TPR) repeat protein
MSITIKQELEDIDKLVLTGHYHEALEALEKLLKRKEITKEEEIEAKLLQTQSLGLLGFYNQLDREHLERGLKIAEETVVDSKKLDNPSLLVFSLFGKLYSQQILVMRKEEIDTIKELEETYEKRITDNTPHYEKIKSIMIVAKVMKQLVKIWEGEESDPIDLEKMVEALNESLNISKKIEDKDNIWNRYYNLGGVHNIWGKPEKVLHYRTKQLEVAKEIGNKYYIMDSYRLVADAFKMNEKLNESSENFQKAIEIAKELENETWVANLEDNLAWNYFSVGEMERALFYFEKNLEYYRKINVELSIGGGLYNCGYVYKEMGRLKKALDCLTQAHEILERTGVEYDGGILGPISDIYMQQGKLDEALKIKEDRLKLAERQNFRDRMANQSSEISNIYWQKGLQEKALELAQRSLQIYEEIGNRIWISFILQQLIYYTTELNQKVLAQQYLDQFKLINTEVKNKPLNQRYRFSEAFFLKESDDPKERMRAEVLFESLLEEEIPYKMQNDILLNICDLLLKDLKVSENEENIQKIENYVIQMHDLAKKNNAYPLLAESLILQSQLALLDLDVDKAKKLLSQSLKIAEERELGRLEVKILQEKEKLAKQAIELKALEDTPVSLSKKIEIVKLDETFSDFKKERLADVQFQEADSSRKLFSIQI